VGRGGELADGYHSADERIVYGSCNEARIKVVIALLLLLLPLHGDGGYGGGGYGGGGGGGGSGGAEKGVGGGT
jgi:hypothetical protein